MSILLVKNGLEESARIVALFNKEGLRAEVATRGSTAISLLKSGHSCPDLVIIDLDNTEDGQVACNLAIAIREIIMKIPIILIVGDHDGDSIPLHHPDFRVYHRPIEFGSLLIVVYELLDTE
jgi:DNA-binding response OmpR family regulator